MEERNKRVLVGMSGGIDSTATCLMLQEQGYEIVGVTMRVWGDEPQDARELAERRVNVAIRAIQQNFGYFIKRIFMGIEIMNHILVRRRIETSVATPNKQAYPIVLISI